MAQSKNNVIIHGLSGKFGNLIVFRQLEGGVTIAAKAPSPSNKPVTEAKQATTRNFQQATIYAKAALVDTAVKQAYDAAVQPRQNAWNVAIADFMNAPDIHSIDLSAYTGQPGQAINIRVEDDFKVTAVKLAITNEDGSLVEEGYATQEGNTANWTYMTTAVNPRLTGDKITITATDTPANLSQEAITLE